MDEAEKARRRKLALQKLARVFKGDEPARVPASNAYGVLAERKILTPRSYAQRINRRSPRWSATGSR